VFISCLEADDIVVIDVIAGVVRNLVENVLSNAGALTYQSYGLAGGLHRELVSLEGEPLERLTVLRMAARREDLIEGLCRGALKAEGLLSFVGREGDSPIGINAEKEHPRLIEQTSKMILVSRGSSNSVNRRRDISGDDPHATQRVVYAVTVAGDVLGTRTASAINGMPLKSLTGKVMPVPMLKHLFKSKTFRK
jgi:hypothetical protein